MKLSKKFTIQKIICNNPHIKVGDYFVYYPLGNNLHTTNNPAKLKKLTAPLYKHFDRGKPFNCSVYSWYPKSGILISLYDIDMYEDYCKCFKIKFIKEEIDDTGMDFV